MASGWERRIAWPTARSSTCRKDPMTRLLSLLLAVVAGATLHGQRTADPGGTTAPIRLAYLYSDGNVSGTLKAYKALLQERPDLRGRISLTFLTESMLPDVKVDEMTNADVLVLDVMNQQMLERFNAEKKVDLVASVRRRGKVLAVGEGLLPKEHYTRQGAIWDEKARSYWQHMGASNQVALMKYALTQAGVRNLSIPQPQPSLDHGYYYPTAAGRKGPPYDGGEVFATWDELVAWKQRNGKLRPVAPRIGVGFYKAS